MVVGGPPGDINKVGLRRKKITSAGLDKKNKTKKDARTQDEEMWTSKPTANTANKFNLIVGSNTKFHHPNANGLRNGRKRGKTVPVIKRNGPILNVQNLLG